MFQNPHRPQTGDLLVACTRAWQPRRPNASRSGTDGAVPGADVPPPDLPPTQQGDSQVASTRVSQTPRPDAVHSAADASVPDTDPPPPGTPPAPPFEPSLGFSDGQSRVRELDPATNEEPRPVLDYDEASFYQTCRYVTSMEATWRILGLPLFYFSHKVNTLAVHLEGENPHVFKKGEAAKAAERELRASTLTAYLDLVAESRDKPAEDPDRQLLAKILYSEIPKYYVWEQKERKWKRRVKVKKPNLGRLAAASPNSGDRFYLRVLLQEVPGCATFEELRTHNGTVFSTFKEACVSRGLARDDREYKR